MRDEAEWQGGSPALPQQKPAPTARETPAEKHLPIPAHDTPHFRELAKELERPGSGEVERLNKEVTRLQGELEAKKIDRLAQLIALELFTDETGRRCHQVKLIAPDETERGCWSLFGAQQHIAKVLKSQRVT